MGIILTHIDTASQFQLVTVHSSYAEHKYSHPFSQGLEGYFRDPEFDQNAAQDLAKRKISCRDSGIDWLSGSRIEQNLGTGHGNSCLIVGNSGNFHHLARLTF